MINIQINPNLKLKHLEKKEAKEVFDFIEKNRAHLKKWLNWVNFIQSLEQEKKYLASLSQDIFKSPTIDLGIWYEDKLIGTMGLINIDRLNRNANLGYCLDSEFENKGIMTECCEKFIDFSFKSLNLHRIEIRTAVDNFRSKAVARRLGFKPEGVLKEVYFINNEFIDCEIFSKIKSEIKPFVNI